MTFSFALWRQTHLLSYAQAGKLLGYSESQLQAVEGGRATAPRTLELACRYLTEHPELMPERRKRRGKLKVAA